MCGIGGFVDLSATRGRFTPGAQRMDRTAPPRGPDA